MAGVPDVGDAAKAADKAAETAKQKAAEAQQAANDAGNAAEKAKAKAEQAVDLAKQAYALAKDPAMRDQVFAKAMQAAEALGQQADKARSEASQSLRDAADGANQLYSKLMEQMKTLSPQMLEEMVRQKLPRLPNLSPQGVLSKLGAMADAVEGAAEKIPASLASAASRAASAVQVPAMPAPPSSPAVLPCGAPMPEAPVPKAEQVGSVIDAARQQLPALPGLPDVVGKVRDLRKAADDMLASGIEEADVAEIISWRRRQLDQIMREMLPEVLKSYLNAVNLKKYGDALGRTPQAAKQLLQSSKEIIDNACRPPDRVDRLLDGAKKWLSDMPTEEIARLADRAKKLKP